MNLFESFILGIVQGITEWLPVSSSGHLVLGQTLFNLKEQLTFDIAVHVGTMLVVLWLFRNDLINIVVSILTNRKDEYSKLGWMVAVGSIPTGIIGFTFKDFFESLFSNPSAVAIALIVTGCILVLTRIIKFQQPASELTFGKALLIGTAQGAAIIPGISRSGSTIAAGLLMNVDRTMAAKFSFLLFIPAMIGATLLHIDDIQNTADLDLSALFVGVLTTMVVSYLVIKWLLSIVQKGKLYWFATYCWVVGVSVLFFL